MPALTAHRRAISTPTATAAGFDYSRFLAAYVAYEGTNSAGTWADLSGNARPLIPNATATPFVYRTSTLTGRACYATNGDGNDQARGWNNGSTFSATANNYTIYMAFTPNSTAAVYWLLFADPTANTPRSNLYLTDREGVAIYQGGQTGVSPNIPVGQKTIIEYDLRSGAAAITVNGVLTQTGLAYIQTRILTLQAYNQASGHVLQGEHYALLIAPGTDTAAQRTATRAKLATDLGITI